MKFKNIEMTGFKSFSEKTTVLIEKGLTGIVGPNGCGKSNIVEAILVKGRKFSKKYERLWYGRCNFSELQIDHQKIFLKLY